MIQQQLKHLVSKQVRRRPTRTTWPFPCHFSGIQMIDTIYLKHNIKHIMKVVGISSKNNHLPIKESLMS